MPDVRELDLHGVRAREARALVVRFVESVRTAAPGSSIRIVTGLGLHSPDQPVLHRLVRQLLESKRVPHVASWTLGSDRGSFVVRLSGTPTPGRPPPRLTDREWYNARQVEYGRRRAERAAEAAAESAAEARRLAALRQECGGKELPEWLCVPPAAVTEARRARAEAEEADRIEYARSRADVDRRAPRASRG